MFNLFHRRYLISLTCLPKLQRRRAYLPAPSIRGWHHRLAQRAAGDGSGGRPVLQRIKVYSVIILLYIAFAIGIYLQTFLFTARK
jgi:hypothetical protein